MKKKECPHMAECKASARVLFYLDECEKCEIANKFKEVIS
jgi:hypothetical protein